MTSKEIESALKRLGGTYGGPSLSWCTVQNEGRELKEPRFVVYCWHDAPVGMDVLAEGQTLEECLLDWKRHKYRERLPDER